MASSLYALLAAGCFLRGVPLLRTVAWAVCNFLINSPTALSMIRFSERNASEVLTPVYEKKCYKSNVEEHEFQEVSVQHNKTDHLTPVAEYLQLH